MDKSKTINKFKRDMIDVLPFYPTTKEVQDELLSQDVGSVMFHYLHWVSRIIPDRPRTTTVEPDIFLDSRWEECEALVTALLVKSARGDDLTDHLSERVKRGYTTAEKVEAKDVDWRDKLLNEKGFYHLHLKAGRANKENVMLLAKITRTTFKVIGLFDHDVFQDCLPHNVERQRMQNIYDCHVEQGVQDDFSFGSSILTTFSGHPIRIHAMTAQYIYVLEQLDSKLTDLKFIHSFFENFKKQPPKKPKLSWLMHGMDFGLYEKKSGLFLILRYGHI